MSFALKKIPLLSGLTDAELKEITPCLKEKTFKKGEILFLEGRACDRVFIVQTGRVKLFRMASSGREQILETLDTGDTCACNPGSSIWSCSVTAEAVTDCKVLFLSRPDYVRLVSTNSNIMHSLNRIFADKIQCFTTLIEEVSLKDVKKRLVKFLLDMLAESQTRGNGTGVLNIPFTREEMAQRLGTARETVARYLYQLKRSRLIDIKPKQVIVLDKAGLEKLLA